MLFLAQASAMDLCACCPTLRASVRLGPETRASGAPWDACALAESAAGTLGRVDCSLHKPFDCHGTPQKRLAWDGSVSSKAVRVLSKA